MSCSSGALRAGPEEFEFVVEVLVAGLVPDLVLKVVHRAGGIDRGDVAALGADQVIAMATRKHEGEIGRSLMEAEPPHHSSVGESMEQAVNGGLVTLGGEPLGPFQLGQGHRTVGLEESREENLECLGTAQAALPAPIDEFSKIPCHTVSLPSICRERQEFPLFPMVGSPTREGTRES